MTTRGMIRPFGRTSRHKDAFAVRTAKLKPRGVRTPLRPLASRRTHPSRPRLCYWRTRKKVDVSVAGRIVAFRLMGKASFLKLLDARTHQAYVRRRNETRPTLTSRSWIGHLSARGPLFRTKTGEITVRAKGYELSKSFAPPEKRYGLTDNEQLHAATRLDRKRGIAPTVQARSAVIREIREFLWEREFMEVKPYVSAGRRSGPSLSYAFQRLSCTPTRASWNSPADARGAAHLSEGRVFVTRGFLGRTTPNSQCWRPTKPTPTTGA